MLFSITAIDPISVTYLFFAHLHFLITPFSQKIFQNKKRRSFKIFLKTAPIAVFLSVFINHGYILARKKKIERYVPKCYYMKRKSTHSKSGCSQRLVRLLSSLPLSWTRRERHFYLCLLFLLSRKFSNATMRLPTPAITPMAVRTAISISYSVIRTTSLPMDSGKPVHWLGRLPPRHGYFSTRLPVPL